jgi:hypothetical protein
MMTGKTRGAIVSKMATIIPPLMILPKRRTAKAMVRETSLIILKGNIIKVGCKYDLRYAPNPFFEIPKYGTARSTLNDKAAVVERDAVGGS